MKSRSCAIGAVTAVLLIMVSLALLWRAYLVSNAVPVIKVPTIKMPSPNAFDYFAKAGRQLDVPKDFDPQAYSKDGRAAILKKNRAALETLRRGLAYEYEHPLRYKVEEVYPEYRHLRTLARLLAIESMAWQERRDWSGAMNTCLDGMMMGEQVAHGGGLTGKRTGIGTQHVCREGAWQAIGHLTPAQARDAIAGLEAISHRHVPTYKTLQEEKLLGLLGLQYQFSGMCKDPDLSFPNLPNRIKRKLILGYGRYMDECVTTVHQPYAAKPSFPELKQDFGYLEAISGEAAARIILDLYCMPCDGLWFGDLRCQTQNRLLKTALALRAYRVENGAYPGKLAELVPAYLKSLPADPFAMRGSFGYRKEADKYVLWSVGPDTKNDGGRPVLRPGAPADRYQSDKNSKGDIVAGVNDL